MDNIDKIIETVADSTKSAISKTARSIKQSKPDPELNISLSRLIDSFSKLITVTREQPEGTGWYEKMEAEAIAEMKTNKQE